MDFAHEPPSMSDGRRRVAARKGALTREVVSRAEPLGAPYVIWDDRLTGLRSTHPSASG